MVSISLVLLLLTASPDSAFLRGHTVVLSADDGHHSIYKNVFPLLKRYKMTMTLALIVNNLGSGRPSYAPTDRFLNRQEVSEMIESCDIEVASHTLNHPYLTRLDSAAAWAEIRGSKVALESLFLQPVITFVYPYGDMDARIRRLTQKAGYRIARAVRRGEIDFWNDPYRLPEFELRREVNLAAVKAHVRSRRTSILLFHRIVPSPEVFTEWPVAWFSELLAWLHRHGARTTTLGELYNEWWHEQISSRIASPAPLDPYEPLFQEVDVDATGTAHTRRAERLHVLFGP